MGLIARWGCACLFLVPAAGRAQEPSAEKGPVNRLARETSPYLRQHAHNPVDWYPWCPEAFAKARKENKLIFLSVGYSACHWCHVMEKETFSNADVAKLLNASFICIKVDREERPDVDQVCQLAVQIFLQGQAGGWPLSVFLTPDCKPIAGSGAFLPPDDRVVQGQRLPGLKSFIRGVLDARRDHPKEIQEQSDQVSRTIAFAVGHMARPAAPEPRRYLISAAIDAFRDEYDPDYGGFGNPKTVFRGAKFPNVPALNLMLQEASRQHSNDFLGMVTGTLDHMAAGGICDQIGGGFHRYCVERTWTVPHFEKMLSDNAQLVELYARAFERTKNARYRRVIEDSLEFVGREMTAPDGGFYSALDADSGGQEGRFYLWTTADIDAALPDSGENALARTVFGVGDSPMLEGKYFILTLRGGNGSADDRLETVRHKLFVARAKRSRPFLDDKVLTACNGQMIAAYAVAGRILAEPRYIQAAVRAANFVLANLRTIDGRLFRTFASVPGETAKASVIGYLDDYAFLVDGLLDLHDATGDPRWVREAKTLVDLMIRYYGDEGGAFYYTASDQERLFTRVVDMHDAAQPSGNSVAVRDLLRLAAKTGDAAYRIVAGRVLRSLAAELEQNPTAMPAMASSLAQFLEEAPAQPPAGGAPKGSDSVVKATAVAEKNSQGKQTIKLVLTIDSKWHLYANPVGNPDLESNKTTLTVSGPAPLKDVKLEYPKGKLVKDPIVGDYQVYEGRIEIRAVVERASGDVGPLELTVKVSACNDKTCLQPAKIKLSVP